MSEIKVNTLRHLDDNGVVSIGNSSIMLPKGTTAQRPSGSAGEIRYCLLYTSPSPRDATLSRMPSSA